MSAVLQPRRDQPAGNDHPETTSADPAEAGRRADGQARGGPVDAALLSPGALDFLQDLERRFGARRRGLLAARKRRQAAFDAGGRPDFRADTAHIRAADWTVAPLPRALLDRRVEITGPVEPRMVIHALNSGANCYMADFEDSTAPTWDSLLRGQQALRDAVAGRLSATGSDGRPLAPVAPARQAVLIVRPRGWHLEERHLAVDGAPMSASLFDAGLFLFHNARELAARDRGPYLYLPKLESMEEAALWNEVLAHAEARLGLARGQVRVTVLIETLPAAFEMDEILHALRERAAGLNCGRWDYIFSCIKTLRAHPGRIFPERGQVGMDQPFLAAYADLLVRTCHRRGAHAMGGMAAQVPIKGDPRANDAALARVRADKEREAAAGHDGTWVAHPALVPVARAAFDARMPGPHQQHVAREDVRPDRDALLRMPRGSITRAGFDANVDVAVRYLAAWLGGNGCVPIHHLMEDAATAEIARAQLWQWLHPVAGDGPVHLDDGSPVDDILFEQSLFDLPRRLGDRDRLPGAAQLDEAVALLEALTRAPVLADFLTVPAYERLVASGA